jgi:NAD(P)-dependent dehydrogenase (short-subunit alcohol dehydrogenase family)
MSICARESKTFLAFSPIIPFPLCSPIALGILALPHLKKTNGNVLNISSISAFRADAPWQFPGLLKAALDHWTRGLAKMGAPNVRVNSLK